MKSGVVDVVIVNLNGKHYLEDCLPSIAAHSQTTPYRVVIVDNGSTDGSVEWVRCGYPDALVIENDTNAGFSRGCNQGILESDGEYILLLNNDTEFLNDVLGILVECIQNEKVGLAGPLTLYPNGQVQASIKHFPPIWKFLLQQMGLSSLLANDDRLYYPYGPFHLSDYEKGCEVEWLSGACLMFRRDLFDEIGPLDENMPFGVEDMDYGRRALKAGFVNCFVPEAQLMHFKGGTIKDGRFGKQKAFLRESYEQGIMVYFMKHHSDLEYWLIRLFFALGRILRVVFKRGMYIG